MDAMHGRHALSAYLWTMHVYVLRGPAMYRLYKSHFVPPPVGSATVALRPRSHVESCRCLGGGTRRRYHSRP